MESDVEIKKPSTEVNANSLSPEQRMQILYTAARRLAEGFGQTILENNPGIETVQ